MSNSVFIDLGFLSDNINWGNEAVELMKMLGEAPFFADKVDVTKR